MKIFRNLFQSDKNNKKDISTDKYFKVLNFNKLECQLDSERLESMREYDGEYNYELKNDYFENAWFKTNLDILIIQYQIFYTRHANYRHIEFYEDSQSIQDLYLKKYDTPFFYELADEEQRQKYHPSFQLGKFLNIEDFKEIILPNLKYDLIKIIDLNDLETDKFYIFYNWQFFGEEQQGKDSNSLMRYIERLPFGTQECLDSQNDALRVGLNVLLENSISTPDTILTGLNFKTELTDSQIFRQESYGSNFWLQAKIANLNILIDSGDLKLNPEVNKEYNVLFKEFEDNSLIPYEITTANK